MIMEKELNYLSEKIENLSTRIAYSLDDGYTEKELHEWISEKSLLENILNALSQTELEIK